MIRCIFLDRDGTICEDMDYLDDYRKMVIFPFAIDAVKIMKEKGFKVFVITNQSGVARGKFSIDEAERQKKYVINFFREKSITIDGYFYCPHHKEGIIPEFAVECECRKPKVGLLKKAINWDFIDKINSFVVGDKIIDMELARKAEINGALVLTGYGNIELKKVVEDIYFQVFDDIFSFAKNLK